MNLEELKDKTTLEDLDLEKELYKKVLIIVDFGNVNYWFEDDKQTDDFVVLKDNEKIEIDIEKFYKFLNIISNDIRFYYGFKDNSLQFIQKIQSVFGKNKVFTKRIQKIKHYLSDLDKINNSRELFEDKNGKQYVFIDKCNFDVEISVDMLKTIKHYDTVLLLSGDADFVYLLRYLKSKGKKIILIKGGNIVKELREISDKIINAQKIKKYITRIKVKT